MKLKKSLSFLLIFAIIFSVGISKSNAALNLFPIYLCGIVDPDGGDRTGWQTNAGIWLSNIPDSTITKKTAFNYSQLASYLKIPKIFVIQTHGAQDRLRAVDSSGNISRLYTTDIATWTSTAMSNNKLAFIGACSVGAGGSGANNIVTKLYSKGSKCVIGYTVSVSTQCNYTMIESFCTAIGAGYTISNALSYADSCVLSAYGTSGGTGSRLTLGNTSQQFSNIVIPLSISDTDLLNIGDYDMVDSYHVDDTGADVIIYNKTIDGYKTDDYAYIMTAADGSVISSDQPHIGCLDGFVVTDDFLSACDKALAEKVDGLYDNYKIIDKRIIGTTDKPGMRYSITYYEDDCELNTFIEV